MAYSRIYDDFWRSAQRAKLPDELKLLMVYLFSSPHRNKIGLYRLPLAYAQEDLGWDREKLVRNLKALTEAGDFAIYDEDSAHVLVRTFLKYNAPQNRNVTIRCVEEIAAVKDSPLLIHLLDDAVRYCFEDYQIELPDTIARILSSGDPQIKVQPSLVEQDQGEDERPEDAEGGNKATKVKREKRPPEKTDEEFMAALKENPAFKSIDIEREIGLMEAWIISHPGRQMTRRFITSWLSKQAKSDRAVQIGSGSKRSVPGMSAIGSKNMANAAELIRRKKEQQEGSGNG